MWVGYYVYKRCSGQRRRTVSFQGEELAREAINMLEADNNGKQSVVDYFYQEKKERSWTFSKFYRNIFYHESIKEQGINRATALSPPDLSYSSSSSSRKNKGSAAATSTSTARKKKKFFFTDDHNNRITVTENAVNIANTVEKSTKKKKESNSTVNLSSSSSSVRNPMTPDIDL